MLHADKYMRASPLFVEAMAHGGNPLWPPRFAKERGVSLTIQIAVIGKLINAIAQFLLLVPRSLFLVPRS